MTRLLLGAALLLIAASRAAATDESLPLVTVADVPLPGGSTRLDYQSLDAGRHLLFVAHLGDGVVHVYDLARGRIVANVKGVAQVHGVLAIPELGRCYASATG